MSRRFFGHQTFKGRGTLSNPAGRFDKSTQEQVDDGWYREEEPESLAQTVMPDRARSVISTNDSPDVGFDYSINPYRGCEHGCVYCIAGETQILMADGRTKVLGDLQAGDEIIGTQRRGSHRHYVRTRVLDHWRTRKPAYRVTLADGTALVASGDHRFLSDRGWKFITGTEQGAGRRPHLATGHQLMGFGLPSAHRPVAQSGDYRRGYLCGAIRGDGNPGTYRDSGPGRAHADAHRFRLAMVDAEALDRAGAYLREFGIGTMRFVFQRRSHNRMCCEAIRASAGASVEAIQRLVEWPDAPQGEWAQGFAAGIFDAEGSYSDGSVRIASTDRRMVDTTCAVLHHLGFDVVVETMVDRPCALHTVRIRGGMREHLRFFRSCHPAIARKRSIEGRAVESQAATGVVAIEPLAGERDLFDITTGTGDFIANGVVSHNCFARPTHSYLGLSPGLDFETKLFYKENAAQLLEQELAKPKYVPKPIALGINTDGYQPLERRLKVTRSILEVLAKTRHPVSIISKSALVVRDLDLLADMARDRLVSVALSVTTLSAETKRALEPRTGSPQARLRAMRMLADAGVPVGVMVAPVIPAITDHEMESILEAAAGSGATTAGYVLLRLPYELKELFREWLAEHYPDRAGHVMSLIQQARGGRDNDPSFGSRMRGTGPYAQLLRSRFHLATRKLGLNDARARHELDATLFRPPRPATPQLTLGFD